MCVSRHRDGRFSWQSLCIPEIKIRENLKIRHINYQKQWQIVKELEEQGNAIVLRPSADYGVTRYTHDKELLGRWFDLGYEDTKNRLDMIREFMEK